MRSLRPSLTLISASLVCALAASEARADTGIYVGLGVGTGSFSGSQLITTEAPGTADEPLLGEGCCPETGLGFELRLGLELFGIIAPEFGFLGNGFDLGGDVGGAGFVGGGLRLFPLGLLNLVGLDTEFLPLRIGLGFLFGYSVVGKDFAYTGSFVSFDGGIAYEFSSLLSLGVRLVYAIPTYGDFVFTDFNGDRGRCLDNAAGPTGEIVDKDGAGCSGSGPTTSWLSPQITVAFSFSLL